MQLYEAAISWGFTVTVRGLPIYVSFWTLLLAAALYFSGKKYIEVQLTHLHWHLTKNRSRLVLGGAIGALLMVLSVAAHEAAHALVARAFSIHITDAGISWWGAYVSLPDAHSQVSPLADVAISLAGPLMNILITGLCAAVVWMMCESVVENTIQYVAFMNWRLGKLNLLPVFVLDGGHAFQGVCRFLFGNGDVSWILATAASMFSLFFLMTGSRRKHRQYEEPRDAFERKLEVL